MARRWQAAGIAGLQVVERDAARRAALEAEGIICHETLAEAAPASLYVLAIKPQQFTAFRDELAAHMQASSPLLVSIMAGVPLAALEATGLRAVRVMPNLPAAIGEGMSVACAPALDAASRAEVSALLAVMGAVAWVEEEAQLHAVTAISGSGPAYLFAFIEALQQAAVAQGLSPELARQLVTQTVKGAALLASQSGDDAATLRAQVTSPGGTTQAALAVLMAGPWQALIVQAVEAAERRSQALAYPATPGE